MKALPQRTVSILAGFVLALSALPVRAADVLLRQGGAQLVLDGDHLRVMRGSNVLLEATSIDFNFTAPRDLSVSARDRDRVVLRAVYPPPAKWSLDDGQAAPVEIVASRVDGGFHLSANPSWARNVAVQLKDLGDHFFGILEHLYPGNRPSPDLRGNVVDVEVFSESTEYAENFSSAWSSFFMTNHGWASFFDTFARGRYQLGIDGRTELSHRTGALSWYVFTGADGDAILASYYKVIGTPKRLPMWAVGPIAWRDQNNGGAPEILDDMRRMTELRIPLTGWWVDRPYSDGANQWSQMNWSALFAHPEEWIREIRETYGLEFMTWIAPLTFTDPNFPGLLAGAPNYMDLSDPAAVTEFERRLMTHQYAVGVRGHKMDRADENFPVMLPWKDGTRSNESRNKYIYLYAKLTHEMLSRAWGEDHFNFARAAIHRAQPYLSAVWSGDARATWTGLAASVANSVRVGFMGFPVWGSDTGGYIGGRIDEELYARWLQFGSLSGMFEIKLDNSGGQPEDRPPWVYGERLQAVFRAACERRMELLPYLYSLVNTSARNGVVMKPLAYLWPEDTATYDIGDEYLLGPALLVAPIVEPGGRRSVYLPAGRWYALEDPAHEFHGRRRIDVVAPFDRIPVFVRANSIYVTGQVPIGNARTWTQGFDRQQSVTIHATPGANGEWATFEYIDWFDGGKSKTIAVAHEGGRITVKADALGSSASVRVRSAVAPREATVNGRPVQVAYLSNERAVVFAVPRGNPVEVTLTLRQ